MLIDLNVIQYLLNDIKMKVLHRDLVLTIVIHHYEILFDGDDAGNASIKKKELRKHNEEKKNKRGRAEEKKKEI